MPGSCRFLTIATLSHSNVLTAVVTGFLKLPAELRLMVYAEVFTFPSTRNVGGPRFSTRQGKVDGYTIFPPVARVSVGIRGVAVELYQQYLREVRALLDDDNNQCVENAKMAYRLASKKLDLVYARKWVKAVSQRSDEDRKWMARIDEVLAKLALLV
ncbi:hypothetical protein LTR27_005312 [Elasticomyces elasticus]|nr:hypothetical protein LTR27_005312 [Elasticomyces elasticus]